jgi:hypothetical protein
LLQNPGDPQFDSGWGDFFIFPTIKIFKNLIYLKVKSSKNLKRGKMEDNKFLEEDNEFLDDLDDLDLDANDVE